jgi:deoxyribodipyrimidine photolyase-like uncharacterized protein
LIRNKEKLEKNPRIGMGYRLLEKMPKDDIKKLRTKAAEVLANIEKL